MIRMEEDWQERKFPQLVEALRKLCERNQIPHEEQAAFEHDGRPPRREKLLHVKKYERTVKVCVYCTSSSQKSSNCQTVKTVTERKRYLSQNKLCFNCTGTRHRENDSHSSVSCQKCRVRHHTSICDQKKNNNK